MGFYLRCRRLQSGAAAQADSGGLLTAKITGFAKAFAGRGAHRRNRHQPTFANAAEFFNSLLDDKWAFPRSVLEEIALDNDADLQIYALHDNVGQFKRHFSY
jgi:hypothetical protein